MCLLDWGNKPTYSQWAKNCRRSTRAINVILHPHNIIQNMRSIRYGHNCIVTNISAITWQYELARLVSLWVFSPCFFWGGQRVFWKRFLFVVAFLHTYTYRHLLPSFQQISQSHSAECATFKLRYVSAALFYGLSVDWLQNNNSSFVDSSCFLPLACHSRPYLVFIS